MKKQKIVTIGGGTGSFTILSGLKYYPVEISAIVSMADDGGSTGILRDELGVLPPGDVRQCLVALSESGKVMRDLFNYRFSSGSLSGHNFGNIFLSTIEKVTGSFDRAAKEAGKILRIQGRVIPVTLTDTKLVATFADGKKIVGQNNIDEVNLQGLSSIELVPRANANKEALEAIRKADKIVINPGNFFSSLVPNLLVDGIVEAISKSKAKKIYVANLMTKPGHSDNYSVVDYLNLLESYLGKKSIDTVIYNTSKPSKELLNKYARQGECFVELGNLPKNIRTKFIGAPLLSKKKLKQQKGDIMKRTLIRHDSDEIAKLIFI